MKVFKNSFKRLMGTVLLITMLIGKLAVIGEDTFVPPIKHVNEETNSINSDYDDDNSGHNNDGN